jgi:hypothetical protein
VTANTGLASHAAEAIVPNTQVIAAKPRILAQEIVKNNVAEFRFRG